TGSVPVDGSASWSGDQNANSHSLNGLGTLNASAANFSGHVVGNGNNYFQNIHVGSNNGWEWQFYNERFRKPIQQYRSNWYDLWNASTGLRSWNGPGGYMQFDGGNGNVFASGAVTANYLHSTGAAQVDAGATVNGDLYVGGGGGIHVTGGYGVH